jgi:phage terminase small subunit
MVWDKHTKVYDVSPYFSVKMKAAELLRKLAIDLGLTPSSRTRVNKLPERNEDEPASRWAKFL